MRQRKDDQWEKLDSSLHSYGCTEEEAERVNSEDRPESMGAPVSSTCSHPEGCSLSKAYTRSANGQYHTSLENLPRENS